MKTWFALLLGLSFALAGAFGPALGADPDDADVEATVEENGDADVSQPLRIAVLPLDNDQWYRSYRGNNPTEILVTELFESDRFTVVEREDLEAVLEEQDLPESGRVDLGTAVRMGRILGAEYLLMGGLTFSATESTYAGLVLGPISAIKITKARVDLDLRLVDTTTAQIVWAAQSRGKKSGLGGIAVVIGGKGAGYFIDNFGRTLSAEATRRAATKAVEKLVEGVDEGFEGFVPRRMQARVAKVKEGSVLLNRGETDKVLLHSIYTVYREGEEIFDPETGESLGRDIEEVASFVVVHIQEKMCEAKLLEGRIGDVEVSDLAQLTRLARPEEVPE